MKINKKSAMARGKGRETMVFYSRRGRQFARRVARQYTRENTPRWVKAKAVFSELSSLWRELPDSIKALWEHYAAGQGSACEVERNDAVIYRHCPIPSYPPRPKLMDGYNAFISANTRAFAARFLNVPRLYPPLNVSPPLAPGLDVGYDHKTKELIIILDVPNARASDQRKAIIWITALRGNRRMVQDVMLDVIDLPDGAQRLERRYKGLAMTGKHYGYKPIKFAKFSYIRVWLAAQIFQTHAKDIALVVSAAAIKPYYILNDRRYMPIEDLIQAGAFGNNVGNIRFHEHFYKKLKQKLAKIGATKMSYVKPSE